MDLSTNKPNLLLVNPRIDDTEKKDLLELKNEFEKHHPAEGYFLIASSGSSQQINQSARLVAVSREALLNSARRFNSFFSSGAGDHWGLVLPEFHIAGLSVLARAYVAGAGVFRRDWKVEGFGDWLKDHKIRYLSLVPAQVHDLVRAEISAPETVKKVFIGAGSVNQKLRESFLKLGWPGIETYGMTETAAMIAAGSNGWYEIFPGVEVKELNGILFVCCDSLLTATMQKTGGRIEIRNYEPGAWYETDDRVEFSEDKKQLALRGRRSDYYKILGEGVSLPELKSKLEVLAFDKKIPTTLFELIAVEDERSGYKLIIVFEQELLSTAQNELVEAYQLLCRPYERISQIAQVDQIPRTSLGKLKTEELKRRIALWPT